MIEKKKIKLRCVNNGKQFVIPNMTVSAQEIYMDGIDKLAEFKYDEEKLARESNKIMVLATLQLVDKKVQMSDINKLHPLDYMTLFTEINNCYAEGREIEDDEPKEG